MPWHPPRQPLVWEWFQIECSRHSIAETVASEAARGRNVKHIISFGENTAVIVSCQGSVAPPPAVKKAKRPKKEKATAPEVSET